MRRCTGCQWWLEPQVTTDLWLFMSSFTSVTRQTLSPAQQELSDISIVPYTSSQIVSKNRQDVPLRISLWYCSLLRPPINNCDKTYEITHNNTRGMDFVCLNRFLFHTHSAQCELNTGDSWLFVTLINHHLYFYTSRQMHGVGSSWRNYGECGAFPALKVHCIQIVLGVIVSNRPVHAKHIVVAGWLCSPKAFVCSFISGQGKPTGLFWLSTTWGMAGCF